MNSYPGSSSHLSSSSSSDDDEYYNDIEMQVVGQITANNIFCIAQHQKNQRLKSRLNSWSYSYQPRLEKC